MAAPTLTTITPDEGKPGGRYILRIEGADFELPPDPPSTGYVGTTFDESMEVEIDGRLCEEVRVYSSSLLTCVAPAFRGDPDDLTTGYLADVVLRNLTGPEESTYVGAFTYKRADFSRRDGCLLNVVRTLIRELRRQVLNNVAISQAVDYDASTGDSLDIVELAGIPGLALFGPDIVEDKFYRGSIRPNVQDLGSLEYTKYDIPRVVTLRFTATLTASEGGEMMNLVQEFLMFFRNNKTLDVQLDSTDASQGYAGYEMFLTDDPSRSGQANESDVREMEATFEVRGVPIDEDEWQPVEWGRIMDDPADIEVNTEQVE